MNIRIMHCHEVELGHREPLRITDAPYHYRLSGHGLSVYRNRHSGEIVVGGQEFSNDEFISDYELLANLTDQSRYL